MPRIIIINGPNLNLLGKRQTEIYGSQSFELFFSSLQNRYPQLELTYYQSNHEGDLIDQLHQAGFDSMTGFILNAGAYTHTSIALADAISSIENPVVEVHISDIYQRENYRHTSYIKAVSIKSIVGEGLEGYAKAIEVLEEHLQSDQ